MNKKSKLKLTAEDCNEKVSIAIKIMIDEDSGVTLKEFYHACIQLAYGSGYTAESIREYFKYD